MQQFQVPQFITVEDRIIGPLTLKQFLYLLGAGGIVLLGWFFLHVILFVILAVPIAGIFIALAFAKVQGRPFPQVFQSMINYYLKPRLYLWRREPPKPGARPPEAPKKEDALLASVPKLTESKLAELAWSLDIKEKLEERGPQ